jgi:hypothetical protein
MQDNNEFADALIDKDTYQQFPKRLIAGTQPLRTDSPEELVDAFLTSLTDKRFARMLPFLSRSMSAEKSGTLLSETASLWRSFSPDDVKPIRLDVHILGDHGWAMYGSFDPGRPENPGSSLRHLQLRKGDDGWSISSVRDPDDAEDVPEPILKWVEQASAREADDWLAELGLNQRLGGLAAPPGPDEASARRVAEAWMQSLKSVAPRDIFSNITGFDDDHATRHIFSFLRQELATPTEYELLAIHRHGRWAAASIRHRILEDDPVDYYLLHPIVMTPGGAKVLPEAILYHATTRAKRYINETVWKRLRTRLPQTAVAELETLYQKHEDLCKPLQENE